MREMQVDTPSEGNETSTNVITIGRESLQEDVLRSQPTEPRQISNEIQVWTQIIEQKNNDRFMKMREEMENKFEAI